MNVGVFVGVLVGVCVGVFVGVFVGISVGVTVGVGVLHGAALATSTLFVLVVPVKPPTATTRFAAKASPG